MLVHLVAVPTILSVDALGTRYWSQVSAKRPSDRVYLLVPLFVLSFYLFVYNLLQ